MFFNTREVRIVKKCGRPKTLALIKDWFVGRVYRMHREFGNCWVEYKDPIDLMDHPSNMRIGLCWYKKGTTNKWTYDLTNYLIIDLGTITTLASMTYIVHFDAYELHLGDEKPSTALLMNARVFHYTYDRGSLLFKNIFVYFC